MPFVCWSKNYKMTNREVNEKALIFPDDEDVEKDTSLSGHLVEKIWILVNFIKRKQFRHLVLVDFYW